MNMRIEIQIIAEPDTNSYALVVVIMVEGEDGSWQQDSYIEPMILMRGYQSPSQALAGLFQCLTFAPPDMAPLEEGLAQVSGLMDRMTEVETAITEVGQRLNDTEADVAQMRAPAAAPGGSRLLQPRPGAVAASVRLSQRAPAPAAPPPPIRQVPRVVSAGHNTHGGLPITAGVGRPGDLAPTGVTGKDSTE